jgi:hypothetical protein
MRTALLAGGVVVVVIVAFLVRPGAGPASGDRAQHPSRARHLPDMYISPDGNDHGLCGRRDPCRSLNRVYQSARPGDVVRLAAGTYPDQAISPSGRPSGKPIVFAAAPGADVRMGEVTIEGAAGIEFRRLRMSSYYVAGGSRDITFRDVDAHFFFIRSADRISILGGAIGGLANAVPATVGSSYRSRVPSRHITISGVLFHDMTRAHDPSGHPECLFIQSVAEFALTDSKFVRCDVFDVYANNIDVGPQLRDVLIQNDFFGNPTDALDPSRGGWYSLYVSYTPGEPPIQGLVVRNNSFAKGFHLQAGRYTDSRVIANVSPLEQAQCTPGIVWAWNVFDDATCGSRDRRAALGFVDQAAGDLHLRAGAAAIGFDGAAVFPARDIDGDPRTQGGRVDAGADEYTAAGGGT